MHLVDETDTTPLRSVADLEAYFHAGEKKREQFRVGTEHELVGVIAGGPDVGRAPSYDEPGGIRALMGGFIDRGWAPIEERGHVIALSKGSSQITLEPGGQFELAAAAVADDRTFAADLAAYVATLAEISSELGLTWLSTGIRPFDGISDIPWMPKQRYDVMREYMPGVGTRGLHMMLRTATVQANLDFSSEADAAAKVRCLMSVTSILTALWASSPIVDGVDTGRQSQRSWIWRDTDRQRSGLLPFAFIDDGLIYQRYTQWALDVPMYFVHRGGYLPAGGMTFRQFMDHGWQGHHATEADWGLHLSTMFPEARLKKYIEVRGCDCGSFPMTVALGPLTRGLLYDDTAMAAATALTSSWSFAEREAVADAVPTSGLKTQVGQHSMLDLARELVAIAADGLGRVAPDSLSLLAPVQEIAATGRSRSDEQLDAWNAAGPDRAARVRALMHPEFR